MTKKNITWASALVIVLPIVLVTGWFSLTWMRHNRIKITNSPILPPVQYLLHSQRADQAVIIPFRTQYIRTTITSVHHKRTVTHPLFSQNIFVTACIGRKVLTAMLDTGCADTLWPSDLKLGPITSSHVPASHDSSGHQVNVRLSVLDTMRIGDLEVKKLPSYATFVPKAGGEESENQPDMLTIGDDAFAGLVLTIDYPRKLLILHPAGYQPPKSAFVSPCGWANLDKRADGGVPSVWGAIEGHKAVAIIDTGWSAASVGISSRIYQTILPALRRKRVPRMRWIFQGGYGRTSCTLIKRVQWSIAGLDGETIGCTTPTFLPRQDLILGARILSHERVTIDYPGKRVWLERETGHVSR